LVGLSMCRGAMIPSLTACVMFLIPVGLECPLDGLYHDKEGR
jgi:hypothetical protein